MNINQIDLFESSNRRPYASDTINAPDLSERDTPPPGNNKPAISDIDQHMIGIISEYIKKLPDNDTKKYIARIMINFIMKSANL